MPSQENDWSTGKIALVAAGAGVVALLLLLFWLGFAFWSSLLWGLIVGGVVYVILTLNFASPGGTGTDAAHDSGASVASAEAAAAVATATTMTPSPQAASAATKTEPPAAKSVESGDLPGQSVLNEGVPAQKNASDAAAPGKAKSTKAGKKPAKAAKPASASAPATRKTESTDASGKKPRMLSKPRAAGADNLKEIKGVGPKLETMLNAMGVYHFNQIAGWSPEEIAWVDANLKGFKGRVSRDGWQAQAKVLAAGGETEFSKRVDKGGVY